jgi:hypothetical protein
MSDTSSSRELYEEIHQRTVGKYGIIEVPSDKARDLVERVVAMDSTHDITCLAQSSYWPPLCPKTKTAPNIS